jgi:hypothetical protein
VGRSSGTATAPANQPPRHILHMSRNLMSICNGNSYSSHSCFGCVSTLRLPPHVAATEATPAPLAQYWNSWGCIKHPLAHSSFHRGSKQRLKVVESEIKGTSLFSSSSNPHTAECQAEHAKHPTLSRSCALSSCTDLSTVG